MRRKIAFSNKDKAIIKHYVKEEFSAYNIDLKPKCNVYLEIFNKTFENKEEKFLRFSQFGKIVLQISIKSAKQ